MWAGMAGVGTEGARKVPESGRGGARSPVGPGGARLALELEVVSQPRALLREGRHGQDRVVAGRGARGCFLETWCFFFFFFFFFLFCFF